MTAAADGPLLLDGEPWRLLQEWLPANDDPDRPQMTLSTVTPEGAADARTVLLTEFDSAGFYFHTDARSRKAAQLAANPSIALTVLWPGFTRQLMVQACAEVAPAQEIAAAYRNRSLYLQQLAWDNTAEFAVLPAAERVVRWRESTLAHPDGFTQPPTWIGYLARPYRLTFWVGDPEATSLRHEFTASDGVWCSALLPG